MKNPQTGDYIQMKHPIFPSEKEEHYLIVDIKSDETLLCRTISTNTNPKTTISHDMGIAKWQRMFYKKF